MAPEEIFDRDQNHDRSEPAWAALSLSRRLDLRQNLAGEINLFVGRAHDRVGAVDAEPGLSQFLGRFGITAVNHQNVQKFAVGLGHACDGNRQTLGGHQNAGRPRDRVVADNRTHGGDRGGSLLERFGDAGNGQDGSDAGDRVAGREQHHGRRHDGIDHARGGFARFQLPAKRIELTGS